MPRQEAQPLRREEEERLNRPVRIGSRGQTGREHEDAQQSEKELVHQAVGPRARHRSDRNPRRPGEDRRGLVRPGERLSGFRDGLPQLVGDQRVLSGSADRLVLRRDPVELVRSEHRSTGNDIVAAAYGMPRALPSDYALASGDQIEVVRALPSVSPSDKIEFVRTQPRSSASRRSSPPALTGRTLESARVSLSHSSSSASERRLQAAT